MKKRALLLLLAIILLGSFAIVYGQEEDNYVDEINPEKGKIKVLVSFFGRETPLELDFLQVKRL